MGDYVWDVDPAIHTGDAASPERLAELIASTDPKYADITAEVVAATAPEWQQPTEEQIQAAQEAVE